MLAAGLDGDQPMHISGLSLGSDQRLADMMRCLNTGTPRAPERT